MFASDELEQRWHATYEYLPGRNFLLKAMVDLWL
jgi:hypothetical protein